MKVGVVGVGVVGGAITGALEYLGHDVTVHDTKYDGRTKLSDLLGTEVMYICVPVPNKGFAQDDTILAGIIAELATMQYEGIIIIKSTVLPGTTDLYSRRYLDLRIVFSPEFLHERTARYDIVRQPVCVLGIDPLMTSAEMFLLKELHEPMTINRDGIRFTTSITAELLKYFLNVYNALRIVLANSFYEVAEALDADYAEITDLARLTGFLSGKYIDCDKNLRGFGGTCLPKDSQAFAAFVSRLLPEKDLQLFWTIVKENSKFPTTVFPGMRE